MEIILRENVEKVGLAGELVKVKDGYARNFLLPKRLAYRATEGAKRRVEAEQKHRRQLLEMERSEADKLAAILTSLTLEFTAKTGDGDRLFGSITTADIAEKLAAQGHTIDKRIIEMRDPIKVVGDHKVPVRLHTDVRPEIQVTVRKEE